MISRIDLKNRARDIAFSNKWNIWKPLVIYLLVFFVIGFISGIANPNQDEYTVFDLITSIISIASAFLTIGYMKYLLNIARGVETSLKDIWSFKNIFWSAIALTLLVAIFTYLWMLLLIIPGIIAALSYSMAFYIKADDPSISAMDAIKKSKEMMMGHKMEYFILGLSFIGWILLGYITIGIAMIWVVPYIYITMALYYDELRKLNGGADFTSTQQKKSNDEGNTNGKKTGVVYEHTVTHTISEKHEIKEN